MHDLIKMEIDTRAQHNRTANYLFIYSQYWIGNNCFASPAAYTKLQALYMRKKRKEKYWKGQKEQAISFQSL
jgi:hypothetical protein